MLVMNSARSAFAGSKDAATVAREAMSGFLDHQTWSWFTGGWPARAPPSRTASTGFGYPCSKSCGWRLADAWATVFSDLV